MIKKLDSKIIDQIQSEQIITNTYVVVKELLENSLDANANYISCFISFDQNLEIEFIDNGIGISQENLKKIAQRGATSKTVNDESENIIGSSFGFRVI